MRTKHSLVIVFFFAFLVLLFSCRKHTGVELLDPQEVLEIVEGLSDFVKKEEPTFEAFERFVSTLPYYKTSSLKDSILSVVFTDGSIIHYDYYGKTQPLNDGVEPIDTVAISHMLDSLFSLYLSTPDSPSSIKEQDEYSTRATSSGERIVLTKKRVMLWSPWLTVKESNPEEYEKLLAECDAFSNVVNANMKGKVQVSITPAMTSVSDMKRMDKYDIVILCSHGDEHGRILLPMEFLKNENERRFLPQSVIDYYLYRKGNTSITLHQKEIEKLLPDNLSSTIIWTSMCYAGISGSELYKACKSKNVADFFGADNNCNVRGVVEEFAGFLPLLLSFHSSRRAFELSSGNHGHSFIEKGIVNNYKYCRLGDNNHIVGYQMGIPTGARRASSSVTRSNGGDHTSYVLSFRFIFPTGLVSSINEVEHGIALYDCSTRQTLNIPVDSRTLDYYSFIEFDDVTVIDIGLKASLLKPDCEYRFGMYEINAYGDIEEYGEKTSFMTNNNLFCPDNHHPHMIDMGLSVKWSCCNIGAESPKDGGGYYAWGEISEKDFYGHINYKYSDGTTSDPNDRDSYTKYNNYGDTCRLELSDDVAFVLWGETWHMPSIAQCQELIDNTSFEFLTYDGQYGGLFTSIITGNMLFFPCAGYKGDYEFYDNNRFGSYWTSEKNIWCYATQLCLRYSWGVELEWQGGLDYPYHGFSVRPVTE